jgi:hypothetical protein
MQDQLNKFLGVAGLCKGCEKMLAMNKIHILAAIFEGVYMYCTVGCMGRDVI